MAKHTHSEVDCYSAGERTLVGLGRKLRAGCFGPLLRWLDARGVTPDQLTLASLLAGLAFVPLFFCSKPAAFVALAAHVLLDGLDGPLARQTGRASRRGSLSDTAADQAVIAATTLTLMATHAVGAPCGGLYVFLYTVVVVLAMVRNAMAIPDGWLVRPRLIVFAWMPVEVYLLPGSLDYVLWTFNTLLALKVPSGLLRVRQRL